jgi:hypothetical protein
MIRLIESKEEFFKLKDEWNVLLNKMDSPCIFLTWEWMYTWWDYYLSGDKSCHLFILLISDQNSNLVGILPAYLRTCGIIPGIHYTRMRFLGSETESPDYLDIISEPSKTNLVLDDLFTYFKNCTGKIDYIEFTDINEESSSLSLLAENSKKSNYYCRAYITSVCPYLKLPAGYETLISSLSSKFRSNLNRYTKILMEKEGVIFNEVTGKNELQQMVDTLFLLHKKRWGKYLNKSKFYSKNRMEFHSRLAAVLYDSSFLRLFYLSIKSDVIACLYCFDYRNKLYDYQKGFDPNCALKGAGIVLIGKSIEKCIHEQKVEYDFLRGKEEYKLRWTSDIRHTYSIETGLTAKGKCIFLYRSLITNIKTNLKRFTFGYKIYRKLFAG